VLHLPWNHFGNVNTVAQLIDASRVLHISAVQRQTLLRFCNDPEAVEQAMVLRGIPRFGGVEDDEDLLQNYEANAEDYPPIEFTTPFAAVPPAATPLANVSPEDEMGDTGDDLLPNTPRADRFDTEL
jgi:hypothetical protein